jgi:beta-glucosidase
VSKLHLTFLISGLLLVLAMNSFGAEQPDNSQAVEERIIVLMQEMSLAEKVGQMTQLHANGDSAPVDLGPRVRAGRLGAILNSVDVNVVNELQRIAVEESRLGIPLLVGRDVIHGFKTILPIPLGQAATWNPELVRQGAEVAAREAATVGINWTFAPMVDISRDARWGRIAESFGEDPYLTSQLGAAMVEGFQGDDLSDAGRIAACAKHFAGYGAAESGRDYATTNIPENELRNVYLRPFDAAVDAGVRTLMTSFSDLDGVPATANQFLLRQVLRDEWSFDGFVVSDWDSIRQLRVHGLTASDRDSALEAVTAGVDMEMAGDAYIGFLEDLVEKDLVSIETIDTAVANILRVKLQLGLFEDPYTEPTTLPPLADEGAFKVARKAALQSIVMLTNEGGLLPLSVDELSSVAVIGPLSDAPYEQLGTWIFDGDPEFSITPLHAIRSLVGDSVDVSFVQAMQTSRSRDIEPFAEAVIAARNSDAAILFLGEEAILSGEAHSRADIDLPGEQVELVRQVRRAGKPVIAVILAGRPLTLTNIVDEVDAILYAWHPGTMGGPAIADVIFGVESPSGKLPATFPRMVGQIPIYYNQKNSGKPPRVEDIVHIDDIDVRAPQTSFGMSAFHLDAGFLPLFPFGHGLSYGNFEYANFRLSTSELKVGNTLTISVDLSNNGSVVAEEVVQMYVRDLVGSVTRPVRELKGFRRVRVEPGQTTQVDFELSADDLAFFGRNNKLVVELGDFHVWVGGSSATEIRNEFRLVAGD